MAWIQKVLSEGAQLRHLFKLMREGGSKYHYKQAIIGSPAKHCADDGPTLNSGLVALRFSGDPYQYC